MPRGTYQIPNERSFEAANPGLAGLAYGNKLQEQMLANSLNQVKLQYAQPNAEQALQQALLQNKWYGPNMQSQIGLRGAQSGLIGEQANALREEIPWIAREKMAGIQNTLGGAEQAYSAAGLNRANTDAQQIRNNILPQQLMQALSQGSLQNEGLDLVNQGQAIENRYAPQRNEANISNTRQQTQNLGSQNEMQLIRNKYLPEALQADISAVKENTSGQFIKNALLPRQMKAEREAMQAQTAGQLIKNQYLPDAMKADIETAKATGRNINSQAAINELKTANPELFLPEEIQTLNYLQNMTGSQEANNGVFEAALNKKLYGSALGPLGQKQLEIEAKNEEAYNKEWNKVLPEADLKAEGAQAMLPLIQKAEDAYNGAKYKGQAANYFVKEGEFNAALASKLDKGYDFTSESEFSNVVKNELNAKIKELNGLGAISDADAKSLEGMLPRLNMSKQAFSYANNAFKAASLRAVERADFLSYYQQNYAGNPATAHKAWREYIKRMPLIDTKTNTINEQYKDGWKYFASPDAIKEIRNNNSYNPFSSKNIEHTASQKGVTPDEVKQELKRRRLM